MNRHEWPGYTGRPISRRAAVALLAGVAALTIWTDHRPSTISAAPPPTTTQVTYPTLADYDLVVYEDGSGVLYDGPEDTANEVVTFDEWTFPWGCASMGNHICGSPWPCTEADHDAPCVANGDNEPTVPADCYQHHGPWTNARCQFADEHPEKFCVEVTPHDLGLLLRVCADGTKTISPAPEG